MVDNSATLAGMTLSRKIIVSVEDIRSVILECALCKTRVSNVPGEIDFPPNCPNPSCLAEWLPLQGSGKNEAVLPPPVRLVRAIQSILKNQNSNAVKLPSAVPGFTVLLEFDDHAEN